jgi:glucose-1-phosphate thymidylyltransferase
LSEFVRVIQHRQGMQVACLEEIAYLNGFIDRNQLIERGKLFAADRLRPKLT